MSKVGVDLESLSVTLSEEGAPWESGPTTMTALTERQARQRLGFVPPPGAPSLQEMALRLKQEGGRAALKAAASVGAPPSYDLRNVGGKNFVTPVRDQGGCGSCVSFGVSAVIESTLRVAAGDPNLDANVSEAHLFYCLGRARGRNCANGWWPEEALACIRAEGLAFEASYPYTPGDQACTGLKPDWKNRYVSLQGAAAVSGAAIKQWISTKGPVTGCFIVYQDFFAYRSGVYRHVSGGEAGGHCVAIIGYDDAAGCWICKNSWGTGWGDGGFFRIAYGECGIDSWFGPFGADRPAITQTGATSWSGWAGEAGVLTSNIGVGSNADGRLEVFVRGTDNAVWHKWQTAPNGGWSGWASLAGTITSDISVGKNANGRLEIFARGTDNAVWHRWQTVPNGAWSAWASLEGVVTSNTAVGRNADGRLEIFARGTDNAVWHRWQTAPNGAWSGWASLGGVITSNIAVGQNKDGRLEIFARGADNAMWHNWQTAPNGGWSGWFSQQGTLTSDITIGQNGDGRLEAFVRGSDNALWHKWQTAPNGAWSGWMSQGGVLTSNIGAGRKAGGRLEVFVRGTDNALYRKFQTAVGWSPWTSEGGVLTSDIAVGQNADGRLEVFVRGSDQALYHKWQTSLSVASDAGAAVDDAALLSLETSEAMPSGTMTASEGMPSGSMMAAASAGGMPSGAMTGGGAGMPAGLMQPAAEAGANDMQRYEVEALPAAPTRRKEQVAVKADE
ncbi:MAG TPA: C1 family peptidase [Hyphomonadaceae bacterium]|jgi:hypothetical protein|nr:C1 family peptidase [Hyphomonadaceae bacterium]